MRIKFLSPETIIKRWWKIEDLKAKALEDYSNRLRELGKALKDLQARCEHKSVSYHGDASGNNDSYNECDTCRKEF